MATNKKVSQKDLRQMMKEMKSKAVSRVESPLARYDSNGQLICIICEIVIKSDSLWSSHIVSKLHKNVSHFHICFRYLIDFLF
jgi:zinc finger protein 830